MVKSVFITGAKGGIGLAFVQKFAKMDAETRPEYIFASGRKVREAKELLQLADDYPNVHLVELDITDDDQIDRAVQYVANMVGEDGLNLLINNAGVLRGERGKFPCMKRSLINQHFDTNATSTLLMTQAFLPLLKLSADKNTDRSMSIDRSAVINIASEGGSLAMPFYFSPNMVGMHAYTASKAALNMFTKNLGYDLRDYGVLIAGVCPGYVMTGMTRTMLEDVKNQHNPIPVAMDEKYSVTAEESVDQVYAVMRRLGVQHTGGFFRRNGQKVESYEYAGAEEVKDD